MDKSNTYNEFSSNISSFIFNVFGETGYAWILPLCILLFFSFFIFLKNLPPHISLFLTEINPHLSSQISEKTWYTWWQLALTIYSDGHSQNQ